MHKSGHVDRTDKVELIEEIGSVVRIGPNELSFANPSAIRDIYMTSNFQKEEAFYVRLFS